VQYPSPKQNLGTRLNHVNICDSWNRADLPAYVVSFVLIRILETSAPTSYGRKSAASANPLIGKISVGDLEHSLVIHGA
jgi:hypothetical protein